MVLTVSFSVTVITRDFVTLKVEPVCVEGASLAPGVSTSQVGTRNWSSCNSLCVSLIE